MKKLLLAIGLVVVASPAFAQGSIIDKLRMAQNNCTTTCVYDQIFKRTVCTTHCN